MRRLRLLTADRDLVGELQLALKMTLAGSLAWWLGTVAGEPRPIFATLVPLVAMSGDPFSAVNISLARILGVFAGVAVGIGLLALPFGTLALVALGLLAGALAGIALRVGDRPNVQAAVSALFLIGLGGSAAAHAGVARIWETAIGAGVTVPVSALLWPPHPVRGLRLRLGRLRQALAGDLAAVAEDLAVGNGAAAARLEDLRLHSLDAMRDLFELDRARNALRWNPLRRTDAAAFPELARQVRLAARLFRHARSVARDVADADASLRGGAAGAELAAATRAIAEAADLALGTGRDEAALDRAEARLADAAGAGPDALIVLAQLRQLLADLRALS